MPTTGGLYTGAQPRLDHPDHGDLEALLERVERRGGSVVACDHERLHVPFEEEIGDLQGVLQHVLEGFRSIGEVTCVTEIDHRFGGEQIDQRAQTWRQTESMGYTHDRRHG